MKFLYRFAEGCWLLWAISAVAALAELASGSVRAAGFSVIGMMLYCIMGFYAAEGRQAGLEQVTSGRAALPEWVARFVVYSAPVAGALGFGAALVYMVAFRNPDGALNFIYIAPNVVMAAASLYGGLRTWLGRKGPARGGGRPVLDRQRFLIGAALLGVDALGVGLMFVTRNAGSGAEGLRTAAEWAMLIATLAYLGILFRAKGYKLAKDPSAVMDDGDRPPLWARCFLIYTAQGGVICIAFNVFIILVSGAWRSGLMPMASVICMTGMIEAVAIALADVLARIVRGLSFVERSKARPRSQQPPMPQPPKPEPAQIGMAAKEWERLKKTRARELDRELAASKAKAAGPEPAVAVPPSDETAKRRALQEQAVQVIRQYHAKRVRQRENSLVRGQTPKAAPQERKDGGRPAQKPAVRERRREEQLLAAQLERQAAASEILVSRTELAGLLKSAAALLRPAGAALATLEGQQALFAELAALLPGLDALPSPRALLDGELPEGQSLSEAVGAALARACDALKEADYDRLEVGWDALPPEALVRGWRALSVYRSVVAARVLFDAALERLEDCIAARQDCAEWLVEHAAQ